MGFDFLGHTFRQYKTGNYHADKDCQRRSLGFVTLITPSKEKTRLHLEEIGKVIDSHKNAPQKALISRLNLVIRGWANYYSTAVSKETFNKIDSLTYEKLRAWAKYRCIKSNNHEIANKYWHIKEGNWCFSTHDGLKLTKHSDTKIQRHYKVTGEKSPFDGDWIYWSTRMGKHPEISKRMASLLKQQKGRSTHCGLFFKGDDLIEIGHILSRNKGGKDTWINLQALHRHCHDKKTVMETQSGTNPTENRVEP